MSERISLGNASQRSGQTILDGSLVMLGPATSSTGVASSSSAVSGADERRGEEVDAAEGARAVTPRYAGLRGLTTCTMSLHASRATYGRQRLFVV